MLLTVIISILLLKFTLSSHHIDLNEKFGSTPLKTGTTIVGVCCKDGVVLGADTRATGGSLVMDKNKNKIHMIAPHIFSCAAGTSADCDQFIRKTGHMVNVFFESVYNFYSLFFISFYSCLY